MDRWSEYFDVPVDYSPEFTGKVAGLGRDLGAELGVRVEHDTGMDYSNGQELTVYMSADGSPTSDEVAAALAYHVCVSSKGPLWMLSGGRKTHQPREWRDVTGGQVDADDVRRVIDEHMARARLDRVPDHALEDPVPGHLTEMDGLPATVRDVLFHEYG